MLEIPEELKAVGEAVEALVRLTEAAWRRTAGGQAMEYSELEQQGATSVVAIERASHQAVPQG